MIITGKLNLSLIDEALINQANKFESQLMNGNFENTAEKQLICSKLRATRALQQHVHAASLSNAVDETIQIG